MTCGVSHWNEPLDTPGQEANPQAWSIIKQHLQNALEEQWNTKRKMVSTEAMDLIASKNTIIGLKWVEQSNQPMISGACLSTTLHNKKGHENKAK